MGRSYFIGALLISLVLALCLSQGFGRNLNKVEKEDSATAASAVSSKESSEKARESIFYPDYTDPGSNPRHSIPPPPGSFAP